MQTHRRCLTVAMSCLFYAATAATAQTCPEDVDGNGVVNAGDLAAVIAAWGNTCQAVIDSIEPSSGTPKGGTTVVIRGQHLAAASSVSFGGVEAVEIVSRSATEVVVITPPGPNGFVDVAVVTPAGISEVPSGFRFGVLAWATVLEQSPDPNVIVDPQLTEAIASTGLPWRVIDDGTGIELLLVPPGTFVMGCTPSTLSPCESDESPSREVTISQPFYLGRYEVTQAEWTSVMGTNPSLFQGLPNSAARPVEQITWPMIHEFVTQTDLRLPTEAEWEFACRAGTDTAFSNGSDDEQLALDLGWCVLNSGLETHPVGMRLPNPLGFFDIHGNVYEWCLDWYAAYPDQPEVDPSGPTSGVAHVLRGGGYERPAEKMRCSNRGFLGSDSGPYPYGGGLRVARSP